MFKLKVGDKVNVDGIVFPITMFEKDKRNCWWAILGDIRFLPNFGHYGDRVWLIATPEGVCWEQSNWKKQ